MKKDKKITKVTPVTETKDTACVPGSVGEFIEFLKEIPADAKLTLDGSIHIGDNIDEYEKEDIYCDEDPIDAIMNEFKYGVMRYDPDWVYGLKYKPVDELVYNDLCCPNREELIYETKNLLPLQSNIIDEMRIHNIEIAEAMAEMYRRQMAALLEYQTQCFAHFADTNNRAMCVVVEDKYKGE